MSPGAWRPKRWLRPKSRRWREHRDSAGLPVTYSELLKAFYPQQRIDGETQLVRPKWARDCQQRGWMTTARYIRLPMSEWVRVPSLHGTSPFIEMCRRLGSDFSGKS